MESQPITVDIVHGIPESMRQAAVTLYDDAFGEKFAVAIPSSQQRIGLLNEAINLDFAFGAVTQNRLVGLAGYKSSEGSFTSGMTYESLVKHAGPIRGSWAAIVFSLYERSLVSGQLLMDGIVVDATMRGQGIGTRLLNELTAFAKTNQYNEVRLDVIDTNPDASRMYQRNSFRPVRTERFGYLRWLLGFGASTTLIRQTSPSG